MSEKTIAFPSAEAASNFAAEARRSGWKARLPSALAVVTRRSRDGIIVGSIAGALVLGAIGLLMETFMFGFPRLGPIFSAPLGAVTVIFLSIGGGLGGLIGGLLTVQQADRARPGGEARVEVSGFDDARKVESLAGHYGGRPAEGDPPDGTGDEPDGRPGPLQWAAWGISVLTAAVIVTAAAYIWYLSIFYGPHADQTSRIGYTLKNVQRIPADSPEAVGTALAEIYGVAARAVPADPIAAAVIAPVAASEGESIFYGAAAGAADVEALAVQSVDRLAASPVVVLVSTREPAYAMPAAYAAAHFGAPVVPVTEDGLSPALRSALGAMGDPLILAAAPERLIADSVLRDLGPFGRVERCASDDIYRHAIVWARGRWGDFGWGADDRFIRDGYFYYALANPDDPAFAAAGIPMAYLGNYGPLLYTAREGMAPSTDQYLWRLGPKYFTGPTDGPWINLRVLGGPESVSYAAQARADLAVEVQQYRNQRAGMSGLAALGWAWFFIGFFGAIWALFAIPKRLPNTMFFPRLYWPLAILVLGPLGILAFFLAYQGRPLGRMDGMPSVVRPPWAQAVSGTIMSMGIGMALMIASMYLFQLNGMPLTILFAFSPFFWFGGPMTTVMWLVMVVPAIIFSTVFFMGPMMAKMKGTHWRMGARAALPVVAVSMVSASAGMFTLIWYWMNFHPLMTAEDLWLWVTPVWWGAAMGFLAALIPNYLMVRAGWKHGGM